MQSVLCDEHPVERTTIWRVLFDVRVFFAFFRLSPPFAPYSPAPAELAPACWVKLPGLYIYCIENALN